MIDAREIRIARLQQALEIARPFVQRTLDSLLDGEGLDQEGFATVAQVDAITEVKAVLAQIDALRGSNTSARTLETPSTPGARLRLARVAAGFATAKSFSDHLDIPQPTYSQHEADKREFDRATAERYAAALGVRIAWLERGEGGMARSA